MMKYYMECSTKWIEKELKREANKENSCGMKTLIPQLSFFWNLTRNFACFDFAHPIKNKVPEQRNIGGRSFTLS